ncbi:nucleoid-associated protein [Mesorhizobium salmacidum]|uniref:Nucleoid-associated protein n=1 Tax=Mesorhizobium salmacidum TaxID=3015171 RepID=A0ABU8L4W7_9HYPH
MLFENLKVHRVAVHEVFRRNDDRSIQPPAYSNNLESLSAEAMGAFRLRMTDALSGQTQSLQMRIVKVGAGSFLECAEGLIGSDDAAFLLGSKELATKLAESQLARRIPGGMVIVFNGTVGAVSVPFIGVIKAEIQQGFRRSLAGAIAIIEFLNNIFLTPATRLYKIGVMAFDDTTKPKPEGRRAFIFDSNISAGNREAAATYFYDGFLGCALPSDGPYETMRFFDLTKEFIRGSDLQPEKKRDMVDSLYVFVRDEQDPTFTADQFGSRFFPAELQDPYADFMTNRKFTPNAVVRDTSQMGSRLRRRRLKFGGDIELSASPEALKTKVHMEPIPADGILGDSNSWTRVIIRERLTGEQ